MPLFLLFSLKASIEKMYQTWKAVRNILDHILYPSNVVTNTLQRVVFSTLFAMFGTVTKQDAKSRPNSVWNSTEFL